MLFGKSASRIELTKMGIQQPTKSADHALTEQIKVHALEIGYAAVGVTTLDPFPEHAAEIASREHYEPFISKGLMDTANMADQFPEATCIISLVESFAEIDYPEGIASHVERAYMSKIYGGVKPGVNSPRQVEFTQYLHGLGIRTFNTSSFIQLPDRLLAARAGLVTFGKNNFAYCGKHGSFIIITNIPVAAPLVTEVHEMRRLCAEKCRKCIDACPTHAMNDQGQLDPQRCILYNNMFPSEMLDPALRPLLGQHIHGCDECQLACPRNKVALACDKTPNDRIEQVAPLFSLESILLDGPEVFAAGTGRIISPYFKDYARHQRNAAIAMGNSGDTHYLPALEKALMQTKQPELVEAIQWAINTLASSKI